MNQTPIEPDDQVRELFRRAGADPLALTPSAEARQHAERARSSRRAGAAALAVVAVVGVATFVTWPRGGEALPPAQTPSPTVTGSAPAPSTTLAAGVPLLPDSSVALLAGRDVHQVTTGGWALRRCGLVDGDPGNPASPADAFVTRQWRADGAESTVGEDVVLLPGIESASAAMERLRAAYATCAETEGAGDDRTTTTYEITDVGDEAFMVVVEWPSAATSDVAVVVRVDATVAMYSLLGAPGAGPQTLLDSGVDALVYDFVAAASAL